MLTKTRGQCNAFFLGGGEELRQEMNKKRVYCQKMRPCIRGYVGRLSIYSFSMFMFIIVAKKVS